MCMAKVPRNEKVVLYSFYFSRMIHPASSLASHSFHLRDIFFIIISSYKTVTCINRLKWKNMNTINNTASDVCKFYIFIFFHSSTHSWSTHHRQWWFQLNYNMFRFTWALSVYTLQLHRHSHCSWTLYNMCYQSGCSRSY